VPSSSDSNFHGAYLWGNYLHILRNLADRFDCIWFKKTFSSSFSPSFPLSVAGDTEYCADSLYEKVIVRKHYLHILLVAESAYNYFAVDLTLMESLPTRSRFSFFTTNVYVHMTCSSFRIQIQSSETCCDQFGRVCKCSGAASSRN
jgi:hypothetical protein